MLRQGPTGIRARKGSSFTPGPATRSDALPDHHHTAGGRIRLPQRRDRVRDGAGTVRPRTGRGWRWSASGPRRGGALGRPAATRRSCGRGLRVVQGRVPRWVKAIPYPWPHYWAPHAGWGTGHQQSSVGSTPDHGRDARATGEPADPSDCRALGASPWPRPRRTSPSLGWQQTEDEEELSGRSRAGSPRPPR